jgi:Predicted integral membrane protein
VERTLFFTDAVVAIAMTLLILPLLESVSEAARDGLDAAAFVGEHVTQLLTFALSFTVIAAFWRGHDRMFSRLTRVDSLVFWLNAAWMFTIVWLPVATAMVGALPTDQLQLGLYIGSMLATSLIMTVLHLALIGRPHLMMAAEPHRRTELAPALATSLLFCAALALALFIPGVEFWSLLAVILSLPLEVLLRRLLR